MPSLPSTSRSGSRSRWTLRHSAFAFTLGVLPAVLLLGCSDKHIGRPCDIGLPGMTDPNLASVNPQALECPTRLCILPAQSIAMETMPTGAFCTDFCSSDDDCADGEKRDPKTNPSGCISGFACRTVIPKLEGNPVSCKPVCVCKDFLSSEEAKTPPPPPPSCR